MKRLLPLLLLLVISCCVLPVTASAAETVASGSCGTSVNWILTDDGTLTISGVGAMNNFLIGSQPWYDYHDQITTVVIGSGVTNIGNYAFYMNYDNISYVKIADSVSSIGNHAFAYCSGFSYIRLPDSLVSIGNGAFISTSLVSITLPETVTSIGTNAFLNCEKLVSVVSLNSVPPSLGASAFDQCDVLTRIMVPDGCADAYKSADVWSSYAGFIVDDGVGVQTFTVVTSFNGQTIYIDSGETVDLFIMAQGASGTVTVDWYMGITLLESDDLVYVEASTAIQGWRYTPGGDGTRVFYAVVTHTLDGVSESITTDFVKIVVGSGDGSGTDTEVNDRLDQIDTELTEVQNAIAGVSDQIDGVSDAVEQLPDQITDGMQQIQDQEREQADSEGQAAVDQIIDIIPDESENFYQALQGLISVLSYEGTAAVITMPAITIPAIDGLFPETTVLEEQQVDFEYFVGLIPDALMVLVHAFFDIAVVYYCLKEFGDLVGSFANGFSNMIEINGGI